MIMKRTEASAHSDIYYTKFQSGRVLSHKNYGPKLKKAVFKTSSTNVIELKKLFWLMI